MAKLSKRLIFFFATLICVSASFPAFASEGMIVTRGDGKTEAIFMYVFDDYSCIKNEWKQVSDKWFYFGDDGLSKQNTWVQIDGKWYYFDEWSVMLHDTTTPDGYTVGPDGAWITD